MSIDTKRRKAAEASSLSRMGTGLLKGNPVSVKWLPDGDPQLGYTSEATGKKAKTVNVAWYNEDYFSPLSEDEQSALRMGVFAHEILHQLLTNFTYTNKICNSMNQAEASIFMTFANTLEDPAIEYFAPNLFGGVLLDCLRFSIKHIYKLSPGIENSKNAFGQLINALIHFGDMGIVKGEFTFPEAYEYFKKVAPLFNEGITCPDSERRLDIAKECMEITRPLWEEDVKEQEFLEELIKNLMEQLARSGLHVLEDEEKSLKGDKSSAASMKRIEISKELAESLESSSDSSDGEEDNVTMPEKDVDEIIEGEYEITDEVLEKIEESIMSEDASLEKEAASESANGGDEPLPNFEISSQSFKSASCLNRRMCTTSSPSELYANMSRNYSWDIKVLTKTLERIFESDKEENNRATSGSYNIKRGTIGTTARIFDKRRDPAKLKDVAVVLAVDLSGSMAGTNITEARKLSIVFAEALTKVKIPYYIMGFSADMSECDAVHDHFVDWRNKKKDRETLAVMSAHGNNFDGYSIRYATELLRARRESNKILFVISDGEPACYRYTHEAGIKDTAEAIKDSRKVTTTTLGVAIGEWCNPYVLHGMYGKDFIHQPDTKLLTQTVCKKLEKCLKK